MQPNRYSVEAEQQFVLRQVRRVNLPREVSEALLEAKTRPLIRIPDGLMKLLSFRPFGWIGRSNSMKWVSREHVKVDRVACPWLIKKFVDPQAVFLFVPDDQVMEVAKREGATPYDVKG